MFRIKSLIIVINAIILLFAIELYFIFVLKFKTEVQVNNCKRIYNEEKDFSFYSPNCKSIVKHWEQSNFVTYKTNSEGRRDLESDSSFLKKIAFIGDSFTFGAMVPIEDNYNFYAFKKILKSPYEIHNFGTPAEQLQNVINKLKTLDHRNYDHIVYGLTPYDFFNLVDGSYLVKVKNKNNINQKDMKKKNSMVTFKSIKSYLLSTASSRFILHSLMSNDRIYLRTYLSRKPYSGYLLKNLPDKWIKSIDYFDETLNNLEPKYKSKLKIFILPQRAEVISNRLNSYNPSLVNAVVNICNKNKIDCSFPDLNSLSKIDESHFPVDGHLTIQGNHNVGKFLAEWVKNWD